MKKHSLRQQRMFLFERLEVLVRVGHEIGVVREGHVGAPGDAPFAKGVGEAEEEVCAIVLGGEDTRSPSRTHVGAMPFDAQRVCDGNGELSADDECARSSRFVLQAAS